MARKTKDLELCKAMEDFISSIQLLTICSLPTTTQIWKDHLYIPTTIKIYKDKLGILPMPPIKKVRKSIMYSTYKMLMGNIWMFAKVKPIMELLLFNTIIMERKTKDGISSPFDSLITFYLFILQTWYSLKQLLDAFRILSNYQDSNIFSY